MDERRYKSYKNYLIERHGERVWKVPIHAGLTCPNRDGSKGTGGCIYCNNLAFHPDNLPRQIDIHEQIAATIRHVKKKRDVHKFIAYFQTYSNTYAAPDKLKSIYDTVRAFEEFAGMAIGTRPDCISDESLDLIQSYTDDYEVWIEYGLQSAHDETLNLIRRGHTVQDFRHAVEQTHGRNILQCAHIILGLPGESRAHVRQTATFLSDLPLQGIKMHPLQVIRQTKLAEMYARREFDVLDRAAYVTWLVDVLERLPPDMVIQRLTADAPQDLLIAPDWCRNKLAVLRAIDHELIERDVCQGKQYPRERSNIE